MRHLALSYRRRGSALKCLSETLALIRVAVAVNGGSIMEFYGMLRPLCLPYRRAHSPGTSLDIKFDGATFRFESKCVERAKVTILRGA